jgi:hypothetical protein
MLCRREREREDLMQLMWIAICFMHAKSYNYIILCRRIIGSVVNYGRSLGKLELMHDTKIISN